MDPIDYRTLLATLAYHTSDIRTHTAQNGISLSIGLHEDELLGMTTQEQWNRVICAYLDEEINLGRAANLLNVPRLILDEHFQQLNIPRRVGAVNIENARSEAQVALSMRQ